MRKVYGGVRIKAKIRYNKPNVECEWDTNLTVIETI